MQGGPAQFIAYLKSLRRRELELPKAKSREKLAGLQGRAGEQQGAKEAGCRDHGAQPDHNLFARVGPIEPMTLGNMRAHGVRSVQRFNEPIADEL
jgi:hypothetical protein